MASFPYTLVLEAALLANGTASMFYTLPPSEKLELSEMRFQSTGTFNITDIRDSSGNHFTNASPSVEIPSAVLQNGASPNIGFQSFAAPLVIDNGRTFYIDLEDSSAAPNTVTLVFMGVRTTS